MTHGESTGSCCSTGSQPPFSDAELASFQDHDRYAAKVIVCLVMGIFALGLVGYLSVAFWIAA